MQWAGQYLNILYKNYYRLDPIFLNKNIDYILHREN